MFDNPKKELERLQQELLDAEKQPEDYYTDEDLEADLEDPSEWEGDDRAPLSQSYTGVTDDTQLWGLDPEPEDPPAEPEKPEKPRFVGLKFAIALELPLAEMKDMLMKAGFALSHSNKFDIIVEYFIEHGNYE